MTSEYFISGITRPVDAAAVVLRLLGLPCTVLRGILSGLQYLRMRRCSFGRDPHIDLLANRVVHDANMMVSSWIGRNIRSSRTLQVATRAKGVLDGYDSCPSKFGDDFATSRLISCFNLAELHRGHGETGKCLRLLVVCESLAESGTVGLEVCERSGNVPTLEVVRTCLSEVQLFHGDVSQSKKKSSQVVVSYQRRMSDECLSGSEWTTLAYALFLQCRASVELRDFVSVDECLRISKRLKGKCSNVDTVHPIFDRVDREGKAFHATLMQENLVKNWKSIAHDFDRFLRTASTRPKSAPTMVDPSTQIRGQRPRTASSTKESRLVIEKTAVTAHPVNTCLQDQSVQCERDEWLLFVSKSSGKEYFFNRLTGETVWQIPNSH